MKKILMMLVIAITMSVSMFAYEPKRECFDFRNKYVFYEEEAEADYEILYDSKSRRILIFKFSELEEEAVKYYNRLVWFRNTAEDFTKYKEKLSFNTKWERKLYIETDHLIEKYINTAIYDIPFVTRKNFYKITEKKYKKLFIKYMKSIKK